MAMQGPNSGPTVRTQDAGTEKCYADFCADSSAHVSFGYRGGVPASHNHGPRTDTAAGAASSILSHKGTGTWVFEREWAIGSDTTTAPQAEHGKANVNGGGDVSFKPPSEAHNKYAAGLGRQTGRHSKSHNSEPPSFGSETVNYTYVLFPCVMNGVMCIARTNYPIVHLVTPYRMRRRETECVKITIQLRYSSSF